ncbi:MULTISPECIES: hypothetical protein [unclassified Variovorax]|uniref:hypothetical protein n=1 Tax=unclassified Variovorax TaxID=663243 RepID=UPI003F4460DB
MIDLELLTSALAGAPYDTHIWATPRTPSGPWAREQLGDEAGYWLQGPSETLNV